MLLRVVARPAAQTAPRRRARWCSSAGDTPPPPPPPLDFTDVAPATDNAKAAAAYKTVATTAQEEAPPLEAPRAYESFNDVNEAAPRVVPGTPLATMEEDAAAREEMKYAAARAFSGKRELQPFSTSEVLDHTKELADPGETQVGLRTYSNKYVYTRTTNDGESAIVHKHNPPDNPTAHHEGAVLDFTDGGQTPLKHNPFGDLAAEARSGGWGGVSPVAIGVPATNQRSLYGFERRNQHELTSYGRSNEYLTNTPPELEEGLHLALARERLPGFDETRESLFDKYALRKYVERRDLRLLEREALMRERGLNEYHSELQLQSANAVRQVYLRDAVMQNANKWLGLKNMETEAAYVAQGEDVHYTNFFKRYFTVVCTALASAMIWWRVMEDGSLSIFAYEHSGELSNISGYVYKATQYSSYSDVGSMYRFQDAVAKYTLKNTSGGMDLKHHRLFEGHVLGLNDMASADGRPEPPRR